MDENEVDVETVARMIRLAPTVEEAVALLRTTLSVERNNGVIDGINRMSKIADGVFDRMTLNNATPAGAT